MYKAGVKIDISDIIGQIAPEIYGQFSEHLGRCIYDGIYVGENSDIPNTKGIRNDIISALKRINVPVLRWPGGCFAEEYHWRDGIGPQKDRRRVINSNWGNTLEDNSFGTHEFMELCELIGCEPYIALNLGSGTVQEAADWVEYMTAPKGSTLSDLRAANGHPEPWKVHFIGIGNENWGAGGSMDADFYANEYKRYQQFCKEFGDNKLFKVACGPNGEDYEWTTTLMSKINHWHAKGISLHYYTVPGDWEHKGSATDFDDNEYYSTVKKALFINEIIEKQLEIMDKADPQHDISLLIDEWGNWFDVEKKTNPGHLYQQNTMRDAITAAINLNIFNNRCDRIAMANIAQVVNVLQAMILTKGEKMITTPTYEVFDMFKEHQGGKCVKTEIIENTALKRENDICSKEGMKKGKEDNNDIMNNCENLSMKDLISVSASVSMTQSRVSDDIYDMIITLANASLTQEAEIELSLLNGFEFNDNAQLSVLTAPIHAYNDFDNPNQVRQISMDKIMNADKNIINVKPACVCALKTKVSISKINDEKNEKLIKKK